MLELIDIIIFSFCCVLGSIIVIGKWDRYVPIMYLGVFLISISKQIYVLDLVSIVIMILSYFCIELVCKMQKEKSVNILVISRQLSTLIKGNLAVGFVVLVSVMQETTTYYKMDTKKSLVILTIFFIEVWLFLQLLQ